jgi:hypothetical protein
MFANTIYPFKFLINPVMTAKAVDNKIQKFDFRKGDFRR